MKIYTLTHYYREGGESVRDGYHFADQLDGKDEVFYQFRSGFATCRYRSYGWEKLTKKDARYKFKQLKKRCGNDNHETTEIDAIMVEDESNHKFPEFKYNIEVN